MHLRNTEDLKMRNFIAVLMMGLLVSIALAMPAGAQQIIGGHDETSEPNAAGWATGAMTPGTAPLLAASHLLVTEVVVTPTPVEFIEIHNPTLEEVDLSNYYLSDTWYEPTAPALPNAYHLLPSGLYSVGTTTDFCVRFPFGTTISPGGTIVVAMYGPGVDSTFGVGTADFEVTSVSPTIPDMINVGNYAVSANSTTLTNTSELAVIFYWDGASDNVCDVDYVTWGSATTSSRVDKTGLAVDGPDADAIATTYNNDTADAQQSAVSSPAAGSSVARTGGAEGLETLTGGNGCIVGGPTPVEESTWGKIKALYR
jgi:hypothetical protein